MGDSNNWPEYRKLVLTELTHCRDRLDLIDKRLNQISRDIAGLQAKMIVGSGVIAIVLSGAVSLIVRMVA